jgi:hypothetical protein
MRKIRSAIAAAGVAAGVLPSILAAGTASASTTYTLSYVDRCASVGSDTTYPDCFQLGAYSNKTNSQISISGQVICHPFSGKVNISWCGVGGGNGTGTLNIGDNFTFPGATGSYYERMDLYAGPDPVCKSWGSNANGNGITHWWISQSGCEAPA